MKHQKLIYSTTQIANLLNISQFKDSLGFYLAAVAFPNDLKKILKNAIKDIPQHENEFKFGLQVLDKIDDALTKYSNRCMKEFIKIPEICVLLKNYLSKVQNPEYKEHYKNLNDMATTSLETFSKTKNEDYDCTVAKIFKLI